MAKLTYGAEPKPRKNKGIIYALNRHSLSQSGLREWNRALKNVNNCLNTNIYSYLETSGGQSSNLYSNVVIFFQHQCLLEICGSLRQLFSCIVV